MAGFLDDADDEEEEEQSQPDGVVDLDDDEYEMQTADDDGMIRPVVDDLDDIAKGFQQFQDVKNKLLDSSDLESISGQQFITKSGWRKIATAFGVSTEVTQSKKTIEDGILKWQVVATAEAPNGQSANGVGMCASNESNFTELISKDKSDNPDMDNVEEQIAWIDGAWRQIKHPKALKEHDIYATAATRAKNRAISDLVGGGEVSAEEMDPDQLIG